MSPDQTVTGTDPVRTLLLSSQHIAVVGISARPDRPSYGVAAYMQAHGYHIIPVNPREAGKLILGERCFASLTEAHQHYPIDIVDCFRKSEDIPPVVDEAIAIAARCIWMQSGIMHVEAADKARQAGIEVYMDLCLKIEHRLRY